MNVLPESVLTQSAFASTAATTLPSFEHACGRRETRKAGRWGRVRECKVGVALPRRRSRAIWNQVCDVIPFESMEDHVFVESVERQMFPVPYWPAYTFLPFPDMAMVAQFPWKSSAMTLVNDLAESVDRHLGRAPVSTEPRPRRLDRMSTSQPRRRRDSSPRNIHVAAAASPRLVRGASPRLVFTEYPRAGQYTRLSLART